MRVEFTDEFKRRADKLLTTAQREQVRKLVSRLKEQPLQGRPLGPYRLREVRIQEKRVYFMIQDSIVLLSLSGKKDQQKTIEQVRRIVKNYQRRGRDRV